MLLTVGIFNNVGATIPRIRKSEAYRKGRRKPSFNGAAAVISLSTGLSWWMPASVPTVGRPNRRFGFSYT